MTSQEKQDEAPQQSQETVASSQSVGMIEAIKRRYLLTKKDIETYPYVWASYGLVYGGFGSWLAYRWRKLRQLEDRVRILQEKMRQRARDAEAAKSARKAPSGSNFTGRSPENVSSANFASSQIQTPAKPAENIQASKVTTDAS